MASRELSGSNAKRVVGKGAVGHAAEERLGEYEILCRVIRWKRVRPIDAVATEASDWVEDGRGRNPVS